MIYIFTDLRDGLGLFTFLPNNISLRSVCEALRAEAHGKGLAKSPHRWFRAPHADLSPAMQTVLDENGFTNVLCDA